MKNIVLKNYYNELMFCIASFITLIVIIIELNVSSDYHLSSLYLIPICIVSMYCHPNQIYGILFFCIVGWTITNFIDDEYHISHIVINNLIRAMIYGGVSFVVYMFKITLINERIALNKLQDINDEIKTLEGLLPICAWCHKIKNDDGYWTKLEEYVTVHSSAHFTHGICTDCNTKVLNELEVRYNEIVP